MGEKQQIFEKMKKNAEDNGYYLCPDASLLETLLEGLESNLKRYGYGSCPCRVACGIKQYDGDIVCPCEYRDADVNEFGMCFCGLFVNEEVIKNPSKMTSIPERRPVEVQDAAMAAVSRNQITISSKKQTQKNSVVKVWCCTVCGYLCARELPPPICPICKAKAERFEKFQLQA